jgi:gamma-glutamyltranspeptidase/glutathione hydrolase
LQVLRDGGSAVDAMVAVNATLSVVYPHMTGIGGDAFWIMYDATTGRVHALNATGRAAASATLPFYRRHGSEIPRRGALSALTVPGTVDGWLAAHERFGRLPLRRLLTPAIDFARRGFPVSNGLAGAYGRWEGLLRRTPDTARCLLIAGRSPVAGDQLLQPALANTLEQIATDARAAFYEGRIAQEIAAWARRHGGVLTASDFAAHRSEWVEPLEGSYRGRRVLTTPPNSQGYVHLMMLKLLEHFDIADLRTRTADYIDLLVRVTSAAVRTREQRLADPAAAEVPVTELLGDENIEKLLLSVRDVPAGEVFRLAARAGDTTYSVAVDADGNAAGVVQSIFHEWGSGVVAGDSGVLLQNRGAAFSLDPARADRLRPGARPFHTLVSSVMLAAPGIPELVYGTMGGLGQPQTQSILVTRVVDHGMAVADAIAAPRWIYGPLRGEPPNRRVRIEARFDRSVQDDLRSRGHDCVLTDAYSDDCGHAQAAQITATSVQAGADPRADGTAVGF